MRYQFAEFVLDLEAGTVFGPDGPIPLRQRAFQLLAELVVQAPALLGRDHLLDQVWGHDALSAAVLPQTLGEVRQALGDNAQNPRLIETKYRRGYRLLVPVTVLADDPAARSAAPAAPTTPATSAAPAAPAVGTGQAGRAAGDGPARGRRPPWRRRLLWAAAALGALVLVAASTWHVLRDPAAASGPQAAAAAAPALGLMLAGDQAAPSWLAPAGTEVLSAALAADGALQLLRGDGRVGAPNWQAWLREVQGADHALTGLWRRDGDGLVLDWSLVALRDGRVVSSGRAGDPELAGVARQVAGAVRAELGVPDPERPWRPGLPAAPAARQAYFDGLAALAAQRGGMAVEALERAAADPAAGPPVRLALANAYRSAGRLAEARAAYAPLLAQADALAADARLRIEAGAALADHRPADAAAALRALHRLRPADREAGLELAGAQLRARQVEAAAQTLATLARVDGQDSEDPRWHLAQARLALVRNEPAAAVAAAERAAGLARHFGLDALVGQALLEQARGLQAAGELDAAIGLLAPALDSDAHEALRPTLALQMGSLLRARGEHPPALEHLARARDGFVALGDRAGELQARIEAHIIDSERGHSREAYERLLALAPEIEALDDALLLARLHNTLGAQATQNLDAAAAERHLESAAQAARRAGEPRLEAGAYNNLAMLMARGNRLEPAAATWRQALTVFRDSGDRRGEAITLGNLAAIANLQGQAGESRRLSRQALELMRALGLRQDVARIAYNLGLAGEREGALESAEGDLAEALAAYLEAGAGPDPELQVTAVLARVQMSRGRLAQAGATLEATRARLADAGGPLPRSHMLTSAGRLAQLRGDHADAQAAFREALALRSQADQAGWVAMSELDLLELDLEAGGRDPAPFPARAERAARRLAADADPRALARARLLEAHSLLAVGQVAPALVLLEGEQAIFEAAADARLRLRRDHLRILAAEAPQAQRRARLLALAESAEEQGFLIEALAVRESADPDDPRLAARRQALGLAAPIPAAGPG